MKAAALLAVFLLVFPGLVESVFGNYGADLRRDVPPDAKAQLRYIEHHLDAPFHGYSRRQVFIPQFAVVALSQMACGLMNIATARPALRPSLARYSRRIVDRALSASVSPYHPATVRHLGHDGLYLSHLNLILGIDRYIRGARTYDALSRRISLHLRAQSLSGGDWHAQSYPGSRHLKWPADQSVTLASLYLYDHNHHTHLSDQPIRGWLNYMRRHADKKTGLPFSALPGEFWYSRIPRGCAMSWMLYYMAQFAPVRAAQIYAKYRAYDAAGVLGWGGFREWPPGTHHGMDVDSGPILFGIGLAATGLGVGPARVFHDRRTYTRIMRAASAVGLPNPGWFAGRSYAVAPLLGEAILFDGTTARMWFHPQPTRRYDQAAGFPTASVILLVLFLLPWSWCLWRLLRKWRRLDETSSVPMAPGRGRRPDRSWRGSGGDT